jgi:sarcosine/dimethylglycine N-methyltransferase
MTGQRSKAAPAFTEQDVGEFFDQTTQTYLTFWDSEGVLHTGYFDGADDVDYQGAATRTSDLLAAEAGIDASASVLDVGCGCGNFLFHLAAKVGCHGTGLDLSIERIKFARQRLAEREGNGPSGIDFVHGSATAMPFETASFSHVVSQDALFLVPDKPVSHAEIYRVLRPGGLFAFSDFLQPRPQIGPRARKHVYDRVRWSGGYSLLEYAQALTAARFEIILARNLDSHIKQTYRVLGKTALARAQTTDDQAASAWMVAFAESCEEIQFAIDNGEFGWGIFVARKRPA